MIKGILMKYFTPPKAYHSFSISIYDENEKKVRISFIFKMHTFSVSTFHVHLFIFPIGVMHECDLNKLNEKTHAHIPHRNKQNRQMFEWKFVR